MTFSRFTGKTEQEALAAAADAKDCAIEELTYTVLEEKSGFLGMGRVVEIEAWAPCDVGYFLHDYIQQYFDNAKMDGICEIREDEDGFYRINVDTSCNAVLIGRGGRALQDFNRLVRAAASAVFKKHIRLMIDVNHYKEDRYERLVRMAIRQAKDVQRTKIDAALEPMPADERKAIHDALSSMENISTKSEGEGMDRAIHILYTPSKEAE